METDFARFPRRSLWLGTGFFALLGVMCVAIGGHAFVTPKPRYVDEKGRSGTMVELVAAADDHPTVLRPAPTPRFDWNALWFMGGGLVFSVFMEIRLIRALRATAAAEPATPLPSP